MRRNIYRLDNKQVHTHNIVVTMEELMGGEGRIHIGGEGDGGIQKLC